jgi:dihydropteroate synthase
MILRTSKRDLPLERPLVMGILNVTPDSFSDGGNFTGTDAAIARAEQMLSEGADIIDIGGESTRPGSERIEVDEEARRVLPAITEILRRYNAIVSIDTTKSSVARAAADAGAAIINDISGLRFDEDIADVAAEFGTGLILMHSRGDFEAMHTQPPVVDVIAEVTEGLKTSLETARRHSVSDDAIVLDVGIGFGKTAEQNLELIAKLDKLVERFPEYPMLVGTSRKSFIGRVMGGAAPEERLAGSIAAAAIAVWNGASIIRVHDVHETAEALKVVAAVKKEG